MWNKLARFNPIFLALNANALAMIYVLHAFSKMPWGASTSPEGLLLMILYCAVPSFLMVWVWAEIGFRENRSVPIRLCSWALGALPFFAAILALQISFSIRGFSLH